jgi:membrane protein
MSWIPQVDWKDFFRRFYAKFSETDVPNRAAQVAFYFSFAFFPLLLFLISLLGLVLESTETLKTQLYQYLAELMPASAYSLVQKTMDEIIETSSGGKLTLGLLVTLWSASAGVDSIRAALNSVYEVGEKRAWWHTKLQSLILTVLFILLIGIALGAATAGWQLFEYGLDSVGLMVHSPWILSIIQWIAILVVMIFATAVIYSWVPCFDEFKRLIDARA